MTDKTENLPVIAGVEITTDAEGRFNLNALHKASGTGKHKAPNKWQETKQAKELIAELEDNLLKNIQTPNSGSAQKAINVINGGHSPGTFAHELLAIEYAGWIRTPLIDIAHNRIFLEAWVQQIEPALKSLESPLVGKLHDRFGDGWIFLNSLEKSLSEKLQPGQSPRIFNK
ncbi:KilA-N domain-containing protein [Salmonella enterica]|nr:KilA-N domain-containing protein [Salmonella enterica]